MNSHSKKNHFFVIPSLALLLLTASAQQLQKGIHVDLAQTTSAQSVPAADESNAWIVTIASDGRLWFGTNPVSRSTLLDAMISTPRIRDQNLYIKADARAPFADVASVLHAARTVHFDSSVLLTNQPESPQPGTIQPPRGLEVWIDAVASGKLPILQILSSSQDRPILEINGSRTRWSDLSTALARVSHDQREKSLLLKADGIVPFAQVVNAIDACRSTGTKVVLAMPEI